MNEFDAVVIGAGPTGLACGIELKKRGVNAVLIEKGCVVNSIYHYPTNMVFFTTPELLEIGDIPMTSLNDKPNRTEALKYYRRVADHYKLNVHQYETVLVRDRQRRSIRRDRRIDRLEIEQCYRAKKIVVATGYYDVPRTLDCPGADLPKVIHYYKEPHPYYDHDVAIIGAKNSAAIAALELWWTGARVTLDPSRPGYSQQREVLDQAEHREPDQERRDPRRISTPKSRRSGRTRSQSVRRRKTIELKNDFVLAMIGYQPDLTFLGSMGITLQPKTQRPFTNDETLESERKGIYLAGVIVAGHAHQRDLHRERPLSRQEDRRRDRG